MSNKFRSKTSHIMIVGEPDYIMIAMGKQSKLVNYVSVPYSPVYILVNNCFPTHIILMAGLGLGPGAVVGLTERDNEEIDSHRHLYVGFHVPKEKRTEGETDAK